MNDKSIDTQCAEWSEKGMQPCVFIWNAADFDKLMYRREYFCGAVAAAADRIIALREREAAQQADRAELAKVRP